MTPAHFPKSNTILGDDQPEYLLLPAHRGSDGVVTSCWEVSDEDLEVITRTRRVWSQQLTFGHPLQPQIIRADEPELE